MSNVYENMGKLTNSGGSIKVEVKNVGHQNFSKREHLGGI